MIFKSRQIPTPTIVQWENGEGREAPFTGTLMYRGVTFVFAATAAGADSQIVRDDEMLFPKRNRSKLEQIHNLQATETDADLASHLLAKILLEDGIARFGELRKILMQRQAQTLADDTNDPRTWEWLNILYEVWHRFEQQFDPPENL